LLTEECFRRARRDGAPKIDLHTEEHMRAARMLYERMSFEPYRELPPMFGFPYRVCSLEPTENLEHPTPGC
jgi:ribosomal protein S18 acetylase RimI-like enzyme